MIVLGSLSGGGEDGGGDDDGFIDRSKHPEKADGCDIVTCI